MNEVDYHVERLRASGCWEYVFSNTDKSLVIKSVDFFKKNNPTEGVRIVKVTRKVIA